MYKLLLYCSVVFKLSVNFLINASYMWLDLRKQTLYTHVVLLI